METLHQHKLSIEQLNPNSEDFLRFLDLWADDIGNIFPDFSLHESTFATVFHLKVNDEPSGLFIYQAKGDELHIEVDFLVPKYRDQNIGKDFFERKKEDFKRAGFKMIIMLSENDSHKEYLQDLGFKASKRHSSRFEMDL